VTLPADVSALTPAYDVVVGPLEDGADAVGLLCSPWQVLTGEDLRHLPRLRVVSVAGAGTDGLDLTALAAAGITVVTAAEATAQATADLAVTLLLMAARRVDDDQALLRSGGWPDWRWDGPPARDVNGATLGLVSYGHIGRAVARRAEAFDMRVLHHTRTPTGVPGHVADLDDQLSRSYFVSVHVPLTDDTAGLLRPERLDRLPEGAVVVNTARGGIVDEDALCDRLDSGRLFGAGLDVFVGEPEPSARLLRTPHLVLTPHIGSATLASRRRMLDAAVTGLREHLGR
jgi:phosphoglycerate dehydrogenase-like enzyme